MVALSMDRIHRAWTFAIQKAVFQWKSTGFESFLALFLIYIVWHYPWGYQNQERLLKRSKRVGHRKRKASDSGASITTADTAITSLDDTVALDESLNKACPSSTAAERRRFLAARKGNLTGATKTLQHYLQWHQKHVDVTMEYKISRPSTGDVDLDIWMEACAVAMKASGETREGPLPRVVRTHQQTRDSSKPLVDKDGYRLVQIMPAQMDMTLARSSTYALAVSLYLNLHLDREAEERIVVCMDIRAGRGWPNTHAVKLVPFMQQTTRLLLSLFPERLHRCHLYPVPASFTWVWKTVSKVVDPLTREKICLISGPNKIVSPPPFQKMYECMSKDAAHHLEESRLAAFL